MKSAGGLGTTKKKKIIAIAATMTSIRTIDLRFNILQIQISSAITKHVCQPIIQLGMRKFQACFSIASSNHDELIDSRLCSPYLAWSSQNLSLQKFKEETLYKIFFCSTKLFYENKNLSMAECSIISLKESGIWRAPAQTPNFFIILARRQSIHLVSYIGKPF